MKYSKPHHHGMSKQNLWALIILVVVAFGAAGFLIYFTRASEPQVPLPIVLLPIQGPLKPPPSKTPPRPQAPSIRKTQPAIIVPAIALGAADITDASPAVLAYAHGTAAMGEQFLIGMAGREGNNYDSNKLIMFTDPQALNRFLTILLPHRGDVETMVYDPASGNAYFLLTGKDFELYGFDPRTLRLSTIATTTDIDPGAKPAIVTDGTYVYGITNTAPSTVFKVRISDGTITSNSKGHISTGHSAAIGIYGSTTELYFGGGMNDGFEKVNADTLESIDKVDLSPCSETDDMPFQKIDDQSGYVYVGCEVQPYGYRVRTSDLSTTRFLLPGSSLGLFIFGGDLYNAAQDGNIDIFPRLGLDIIDRYHIASSSLVNAHNQDIEPNELFYAPSTQNLYFTAWYGTPGLYRLALATSTL